MSDPLLLLEPRGFERLGLTGEALERHQPTITNPRKPRGARFKRNPALASASVNTSQHEHSTLHLAKLGWLDTKLGPRGVDVGPKLPHAINAAVRRPLKSSDQGGANFEVGMEKRCHLREIALFEGREQSPRGLNVLLRHLPRSISLPSGQREPFVRKKLDPRTFDMPLKGGASSAMSRRPSRWRCTRGP